MPLNRTQLFVISAISREGIADDLNDYLEDAEHPRMFQPDDARLTDAICTEYAAKVGEIQAEDLTEGDADEAIAELNHSTIKTIIGLNIVL